MKTEDKESNKHNNRLHSILLINDDDKFIEKLNKDLSKQYIIYIAKNGYEAIEKIKKNKKIDLIISNIELPILDGHVFLKELSKIDDFFSIPFIFILPNSSEKITLESKERGVIDYITKPFKNSELVTKIESLIHKEYDI